MRWAGSEIDIDSLDDVTRAPLWPGQHTRGQWVIIPGPWRRNPERVPAVYQPGHKPLASLPLGAPEPTSGVVRRMHLRRARATLRGHVVRARVVPVLDDGIKLTASRRIDIVGALELRHERGVLRFWIHDLATVRRWHG